MTPAGTSPADPSAAGRLRVHLPIPVQDWYELALDPGGRGATIEAQWAQLRGAAPELDLPEVATAFRGTLDTLAAHYAERGSLIAAVEWYPATGRPPQSVLDLALIDPLPADSQSGSPSGEAAGLQGLLLLPSDDDLSPRSVEPLDLPAGPAVRLRLLAPNGQDAAGRDVVCDVVQYWVPTGAGATVLITCSTSAIMDGDRNAALLDRLVAGLTLTHRRS